MKLRVRRGSRHSPCPLLQDEQNHTVALVLAGEGAAAAQGRAETIVAAVNLLQAHGEHLATILYEVAQDETQPLWMRLGADGLRREVVGALRAGEGAPVVEIESAGDRNRKAVRP